MKLETKLNLRTIRIKKTMFFSCWHEAINNCLCNLPSLTKTKNIVLMKTVLTAIQLAAATTAAVR